MKDVDRIPKIINKLQFVWNRNPELRLCQLLSILTKKEKYMFFYIEDDDLEKCIDKVLSKGRFDD